MKKIVCIMGATSTGKSSMAVAVAKAVNGEIIGADSMQIYRDFTIGTGKITVEEMEGIPHHLIDCFSPNIVFSAGEFKEAADHLINRISGRGKIPIIAGGTGLYFRALLRGLADVGARDLEIRERLRRLCDSKGVEYLFRMLIRLDSDSARRLKPVDTQRIARALEYRLITGHTLSSALKQHSSENERYNALKVGLKFNRQELRKLIGKRVDSMIASGWVDEVKNLLEKGINPECQALKAIGYRELVKHITEEVSLKETIERIKIATHQYAKRQETWFRKEDNITWLGMERPLETRERLIGLSKKHLIN